MLVTQLTFILTNFCYYRYLKKDNENEDEDEKKGERVGE